MTGGDGSQVRLRVERVGEARETVDDRVAVEEPLEIRVERRDTGARSLSITMRTPGDDVELAAGFLHTEGLLRSRDDLRSIDHCGPAAPGRATSNIVKAVFADDAPFDLDRLQRHFYATSSCGICGKASLEAIAAQGVTSPVADWTLDAARVRALPEALRARQPLFERTGGLHASALVALDGTVECVREDVGRHNAVDKLIGRRLLDGRLPVDERILVLSGRAGFELVQKALVAGIAAIVAIGAPSSLAIELASEHGLTLVGFASSERFNLYSGGHRIR